MWMINKIGLLSLLFTVAMIRTSHALVITSPQNGTSFKEGDTVQLISEFTPDETEAIVSVSFLVSGLVNVCNDEIKTHPTYKCSFKLPPGSPRTISIQAYAVTFTGPKYSQEISIIVGLPSTITLKELRSFTGNTIYFFQLGQNKKLYIKGKFSDGVERDLSAAQTGTTYTSSNEKIVTVNADGLASAKGPGKAQITIRNNDRKLIVDAIVEPE